MAKRHLPAPQRLTQPVLAAAVTCSGCGATLTIAIGESEQMCTCGATVRDDAKSLAAVITAPVIAPTTNGQPKRQAKPKQAKPKYGNNPAIASANRRSYTDKTLKALLLENGPFCPRCKKQLIYTVARDDQENTNVADICHILPHGQQGPRAGEATKRKARNLSKNLLVLCKSCHKIVDDDAVTYTAPRLLDLKSSHISWMQQRLVSAIGRVSFEELEAVTRGLLATAAPPVREMTSLPPMEKIKRNSLGVKSTERIKMGMSRIKDVEGFIQQEAVRDVLFPERLKAGFIAEYRRLWDYGLRGDALFGALHDFASGGQTTDFDRLAAGLSVLTYLFDRCEVFES